MQKILECMYEEVNQKGKKTCRRRQKDGKKVLKI